MKKMASDTASCYTGNEYLSKNSSWHEEDAPWKAAHIQNVLTRNGVEPKSICDVGCGTGAIVEILSKHYSHAMVDGFEISPHAHEMSLKRRSANLNFTLGNPFDEIRSFELCMAIDVIEHVENPFAFLRSMRPVAQWHVLHIPLDMNALAVGRGWVIMEARKQIGHLHYFSQKTALALLEETGFTVVDHFYTAWAIDQSYKSWRKRFAAWPRRVAFSIAPHTTVQLFGGWSLMVLARA